MARLLSIFRRCHGSVVVNSLFIVPIVCGGSVSGPWF